MNRRVTPVAVAACFGALVILGATTVSAQTTRGQGIGVGVKAGINVNNLSEEDDLIDTSSRTGPVAGVFFVVPVAERFAFQPELLFGSRGAKLSQPEEPFNATLKMSYIEVPLLANVRLTEGDIPVSLLVGPSISFRTQAEFEASGESVDLKDETESTDFGLVTGIAVGLGNRVVIDGRYTWGFKNINKESDEEDAKNRTLSLTIGWRFR